MFLVVLTRETGCSRERPQPASAHQQRRFAHPAARPSRTVRRSAPFPQHRYHSNHRERMNQTGSLSAACRHSATRAWACAHATAQVGRHMVHVAGFGAHGIRCVAARNLVSRATQRARRVCDLVLRRGDGSPRVPAHVGAPNLRSRRSRLLLRADLSSVSDREALRPASVCRCGRFAGLQAGAHACSGAGAQADGAMQKAAATSQAS
jgi:hypothetical protein